VKGSIFTIRLTVLAALTLSLCGYALADYNDSDDQIISIKQLCDHGDNPCDGGVTDLHPAVLCHCEHLSHLAPSPQPASSIYHSQSEFDLIPSPTAKRARNDRHLYKKVCVLRI